METDMENVLLPPLGSFPRIRSFPNYCGLRMNVKLVLCQQKLQASKNLRGKRTNTSAPEVLLLLML